MRSYDGKSCIEFFFSTAKKGEINFNRNHSVRWRQECVIMYLVAAALINSNLCVMHLRAFLEPDAIDFLSSSASDQS